MEIMDSPTSAAVIRTESRALREGAFIGRDVCRPTASPRVALPSKFPPVYFCPAVPEIDSRQIAFRIWIMRSCVGNRGWPVIGSVSLPDALRAIPEFYLSKLTRGHPRLGTGDSLPSA